jgi:DNA invertase Pin-like site-specific DNA recombinase
MRVALYVRVSTSEQTVEPQLDALRSYASARGLEILGEYIDEGVSGSKDRRPALDDLMVKAKRRAFDALAVVKLDRLARSVRHLTQLGAELEALGIDLIVVDQGIDTSTPSGRLLFNVLGSIAEFERDLIRERTRAGLRAARKRGKRLGRPKSYIPLEEAQQRLSAGESLSSIATDYGCSKATLHRRLKNVLESDAVSP